MKRLTFIIALTFITLTSSAQQLPFLEGYNINPFSLSPAYAGIVNPDFLFSDFRTDWMGIDGGPATSQLSYSTRIMDKMGLGGRFIYDKSDIFKQTLILGTYSYQVEVLQGHYVYFALSAGTYRNSVDLSKYFNQADYVVDAVLISGSEKSKLKFASDFSALYQYGKVEGGVVFSNLMFGTAQYNNSDLSYKPIRNFLIHGSYQYRINELITVKPVLLVRGGQKVPSYIEFSPQVTYLESFWGSLSIRSGGVWGLGLGLEAIDGIVMNYSYNLSSGIALNTFGSHQISVGIRLAGLPVFSRGND